MQRGGGGRGYGCALDLAPHATPLDRPMKLPIPMSLTKTHRSYPIQDLVIPSLKYSFQFSSSPLLAAPLVLPQTSSAASSGTTGESSVASSGAAGAAAARPRDIFAFFRGDVGKHRLPVYRCGDVWKVWEWGWRCEQASAAHLSRCDNDKWFAIQCRPLI